MALLAFLSALPSVNPAASRVIRKAQADYRTRHPCQILEAAANDLVGQRGDIAEVPIRRSLTRQLAAQVLAQDVGGPGGYFILLLMPPHRRNDHHDGVLHAL